MSMDCILARIRRSRGGERCVGYSGRASPAMEYKDYYQMLGVPEDRLREGDQGGLPEARTQAPPGREPGQQGRRRRASRGSTRPTRCSGIPRSASGTTSSAPTGTLRPGRPAAGRGSDWPGGGGVRIEFEDLGGAGGFSDFFRMFFGGGFPGAGRGPPAASGGPGRRRRAGRGRPRDAEARGGPDARRGAAGHDPRGGGRRAGAERGESRCRSRRACGRGPREGGGRGRPRAGGRRGDLYLRVRVARDPAFERKGDDLATTVRVPADDGRARAARRRCPRSTARSGSRSRPGRRRARCSACGATGCRGTEARGAAGDLLATLAVELPRQLTAKQQQLFEELRRSGADARREHDHDAWRGAVRRVRSGR